MRANCNRFVCPEKIGPYQLQTTIGRGAFGTVKLAYRADSNAYFACKVITKYKIDAMVDKSKFEKEIRIMQQLHHPRIVQLYDLLKDTMNYYIVTEFCPNGDLFQLIIQNKKIPEEKAKVLIYQLIDSISFIHQLNICHRDLKPENILLDSDWNVKLSDFGLSKFTDGLTSTSCGSYAYAAPEIISGLDYDPKKSDIWAIGVILYAMLTGQLPWTKRNQYELFQQIKACDYKMPQDISKPCQYLLLMILQKDPEQRPTAADLLKYQWFDDIPEAPSKQELPIISLRKVDDFFELETSTLNVPRVQKTDSGRFLDFNHIEKQICKRASADNITVKSCLSMTQNGFKNINYIDPAKNSSEIIDMRKYHSRVKKKLTKPKIRYIPSSLI